MSNPVYAIIGDDSFLQAQALSRLLAQLPADVQRVDVDGEKAELAEVLDGLREFSMFGSGKAVVVRNGDAFVTRFREAMEKYVAAPSNSATLLLRLNALPANQRIYKLIDKIGGIEKCAAPKDLPRWIIEQGKKAHGVMVAPDAARLLAELVGGDMGRLDNELAKLALVSETNKIDARMVGGSVAFQRDQEMWHMTNEVAAGKPDEALKRWRQLVRMDSSSEYRAVTWLTMWLEKVNKAIAMRKEGQNAGAIAQELKIWPRETVDPFFRTAAALGEDGAAKALDLLAEVDYHIKTGVGQAATNVEDFLMGVALLCKR